MISLASVRELIKMALDLLSIWTTSYLFHSLRIERGYDEKKTIYHQIDFDGAEDCGAEQVEWRCLRATPEHTHTHTIAHI